eukprot:1002841-Pyramimonas_sp.AAC.1
MAPLSDSLLPGDHPPIAKWRSEIGKGEKTEGGPGRYRHEVDHMEAFFGQKKKRIHLIMAIAVNTWLFFRAAQGAARGGMHCDCRCL